MSSKTTARTVRVRVSGELADVFSCIRVLTDAAEIEGAEVLGQTAPRLNRREPGHRVYVTLRLPAEEATP